MFFLANIPKTSLFLIFNLFLTHSSFFIKLKPYHPWKSASFHHSSTLFIGLYFLFLFGLSFRWLGSFLYLFSLSLNKVLCFLLKKIGLWFIMWWIALQLKKLAYEVMASIDIYIYIYLPFSYIFMFSGWGSFPRYFLKLHWVGFSLATLLLYLFIFDLLFGRQRL